MGLPPRRWVAFRQPLHLVCPRSGEARVQTGQIGNGRVSKSVCFLWPNAFEPGYAAGKAFDVKN
jgi:hypothetical protein